jgi:hypothetical protein
MSKNEYESLLSFLHASSPRVSDENYRRLVPSLTTAFDPNLEDYSRLIQEVEFLVRFWDPSETARPVMVVEGAYPLSHYSVLTDLFPELKLDLYTENAATTPQDLIQNENVTVYPYSLTENDALGNYRNKDVFFVCYVSPSETTVDDLARQTNLVRAINSKYNNLTFRVPVDAYSYYKGYVQPRVFGTPDRSVWDGFVRLVPISDQGSLVRCTYSLDWFEGTTNYWNSVAKTGNLLISPFTRTSQLQTKNGTAFCGVEVCRVLSVLADYLEFSGMDTPSRDSLSVLVDFIEAKVGYSLAKHSERFQTETSSVFEEEQRLRTLQFPTAFEQARSLLELTDPDLSDLNL